MKNLITPLVALLGLGAVAAFAASPVLQSGPPNLTVFTDGTPALAAEVNANFQALVDRGDLSGDNIQDHSLTFDDLSTDPGPWSFLADLQLLEGSEMEIDGVLKVGTTIPDGIVSARAEFPGKAAIFGMNTATTGQAAGIYALTTAEGPSVVYDPGPTGIRGVVSSQDISGWVSGVRGQVLSPDVNGVGVLGTHSSNGIGVGAYSAGDGPGLYAFCGDSNGLGIFTPNNASIGGNLHVSGTLSKAGGSFKIDHPLDPEGKTLSHSFVESPDMLNLYNGNVVLDGSGRARIAMPDWFSALNRDFRYQLTPIGGPGQVWIAEKLATDNTFLIAGPAHLEVSWQVTGIRHDRWADANRIPVEEDKPLDEIGTYLNPEAFGLPRSLRPDYIDPMTGDRGPVR